MQSFATECMTVVVVDILRRYRMYVISNVHDDYASCVNEQDFKRLYCANRKKELGRNAKLF